MELSPLEDQLAKQFCIESDWRDMLEKRMNLVRSILMLAFGLALGACGDSPAVDPTPRNLVFCENPTAGAPSCDLDGYSLSNDQMLRAKLESCANMGCHDASSKTFALDLTGTVADALSKLAFTRSTSGDFLVDELDPDCSNMLTKLTDQPASGLRMPQTPPYWSDDEISCFRAYLSELYPQVAAQ
jgi:hypothetical protein